MENETKPEVAASVLKPFDTADLVARLKAAGVPILKDSGHAVVRAVFDWIEEGVKLSPSKIDDFALAVLPPLRQFVDSKLDELSK